MLSLFFTHHLSVNQFNSVDGMSLLISLIVIEWMESITDVELVCDHRF